MPRLRGSSWRLEGVNILAWLSRINSIPLARLVEGWLVAGKSTTATYAHRAAYVDRKGGRHEMSPTGLRACRR